jgi:hypothetical protein
MQSLPHLLLRPAEQGRGQPEHTRHGGARLPVIKRSDPVTLTPCTCSPAISPVASFHATSYAQSEISNDTTSATISVTPRRGGWSSCSFFCGQVIHVSLIARSRLPSGRVMQQQPGREPLSRIQQQSLWRHQRRAVHTSDHTHILRISPVKLHKRLYCSARM